MSAPLPQPAEPGLPPVAEGKGARAAVVIAGHTCPASGQNEIDNRTEGLAFLLGRLFEPLVECRRNVGRCDRTQCARLTALLTFLDRNFTAEETLMDAIDYPGQERHRREHGHMLHMLRHMRATNLCADEHGAMVRMVVGRWLGRHVRDFDTGLGQWAVEQGEGPARVTGDGDDATRVTGDGDDATRVTGDGDDATG